MGAREIILTQMELKSFVVKNKFSHVVITYFIGCLVRMIKIRQRTSKLTE